MRRALVVAMSLILEVAIAACGGTVTGVEVSDPRIGEPTGPNAALYFTAENHSDGADVLESATTDAASSVEIHESIMRDDGTIGMQPLDSSLELAAGETLVLEPGGIHLMLIDVDRLDVGDTVEVTITWQSAGDMVVEAEVVDAGDTMGHDG